MLSKDERKMTEKYEFFLSIVEDDATPIEVKAVLSVFLEHYDLMRKLKFVTNCGIYKSSLYINFSAASGSNNFDIYYYNNKKIHKSFQEFYHDISQSSTGDVYFEMNIDGDLAATLYGDLLDKEGTLRNLSMENPIVNLRDKDVNREDISDELLEQLKPLHLQMKQKNIENLIDKCLDEKKYESMDLLLQMLNTVKAKQHRGVV